VSRYFDLVENPEVEEGESLTAIARRLGMSKQNASKLKARALAKLRKAIKMLESHEEI